MTAQTQRSKSLLSEDFFAQRRDYGHPSSAPIFIVGLPRAGSTLIEQILSSHSLVEGTMELPDIPALARSLTRAARQEGSARYPEPLASLDAAECHSLGARYLAGTRIQR